MTRCDKCPRSAVIYQRYSGMHLCGEHFSMDVHRKIRERLRKTGLFSRGSRMAVCLDGGRQSATLAWALKDIFSRRPDMDISAIIIDPGERGGSCAEEGRAVAERLEMDCRILSWPDGGAGIQFQEALFRAAQKAGAGILATGECLDDEALRIFLSYLQGEGRALLAAPSAGPATLTETSDHSRPEGPTWIKPLQRVPRREARLFALLHGLGIDADGGAGQQCSLSQEAARLLAGFEGRHPGTYYSLVRGLEKGLRAKPLSVDAK
ncbi:MAG TPA: hypothetical protein PKK11_08510 [Methanothrix sp.]|nr:hypothetical protein [Methanothrix sp.]HPT19124.1 hypothetical protein [Methanothrix sp.]